MAHPGFNLEEEDSLVPDESLQEMKNEDRRLAHSLLVTVNGPKSDLGQIIGFGTLPRLLRVTAYVLKFVRLLKYRIDKLDAIPNLELTTSDLQEAEILWVKESQHALMEDRRFEGWKKQFDLFVGEDGVCHCEGRLGKADLPYSTRHPALLHRQHHLTTLLVRNTHERVLHNGVKETLTELRASYWIVKGRQFVRRLLHRCVICQRFEGVPYHTPQSPPLPEYRVNPEPPSHTWGWISPAHCL